MRPARSPGRSGRQRRAQHLDDSGAVRRWSDVDGSGAFHADRGRRVHAVAIRAESLGRRSSQWACSRGAGRAGARKPLRITRVHADSVHCRLVQSGTQCADDDRCPCLRVTDDECAVRNAMWCRTAARCHGPRWCCTGARRHRPAVSGRHRSHSCSPHHRTTRYCRMWVAMKWVGHDRRRRIRTTLASASRTTASKCLRGRSTPRSSEPSRSPRRRVL